MRASLRNYFSVFSGRFMQGIGALVIDARYERKNFLSYIWQLPNFSDLRYKPPKNLKNQKLIKQIQLAVWSFTAIILMVIAILLAFLKLNSFGILAIFSLTGLLAPYLSLLIVAWCLPSRQGASRQ